MENSNMQKREALRARALAFAKKAAAPVKTGGITGDRKQLILEEGTVAERVNTLVEHLKNDGFDFSVGIPLDTPIVMSDRVVSAGRGIGEKENMALIQSLAEQAGASVGSSRPVAETLQYVPLDRFVGVSGQKFDGSLYIACGISGAGQHLKGIKDAGTIVAINIDPDADIFKNADYGIVGDLMEVLPVLIEALNTGEVKVTQEVPKKKKQRAEKKVIPMRKTYICGGCGYEYDPAVGDPENGIAPGTPFEELPDAWICPACGESRAIFIED